jgi:Tfp pilus assembly protein PilX
MIRFISRLLRGQDGIAMPVVIGALTITTGLAAGTFAVVIEGNHASVRDRDSKRALAAAEAGLQMAALKVSEIKPTAAQCVTTAAVSPINGECPSTAPQPIGNGASYSYVVSTPSASLQCSTVPGFTPSSTQDRCITAIGMTNGVRRRLQMRFNYIPPFLPWDQAGLVGKNKVDIGNNKTINSTIGTNGTLHLNNNTDVIGAAILPDGNPVGDPNATLTIDNNASVSGGRVDKNPPWTFPVLDWTVLPRQDNNNSLLAGIPGWNATTKVLTPGDGQTITLPADTDGITDFWMCGIDADASNEFWLNVPNGKQTRIWIDSPRGTGSCGTGTGTFVIKNSGHVNITDDKNPAELAFFVYGTSGDTEANPDISFKNNVDFYATIWAPDSSIDVNNNQGVAGAFTAKNISLKNNGGFSYDNRVANQSLPGTASAKNLSWFECRRDPAVASDPESGCA